MRALGTRPRASRSPFGAPAVELSGPPRPRPPSAARRKKPPRCANTTASWSPPAADAAARCRVGGRGGAIYAARARARASERSGAALTEVPIETARASCGCGVANRHQGAPRAPRADHGLYMGGEGTRRKKARAQRGMRRNARAWLARFRVAVTAERAEPTDRRTPSSCARAVSRAGSALRLLFGESCWERAASRIRKHNTATKAPARVSNGFTPKRRNDARMTPSELRRLHRTRRRATGGNVECKPSRQSTQSVVRKVDETSKATRKEFTP